MQYPLQLEQNNVLMETTAVQLNTAVDNVTLEQQQVLQQNLMVVNDPQVIAQACSAASQAQATAAQAEAETARVTQAATQQVQLMHQRILELEASNRCTGPTTGSGHGATASPGTGVQRGTGS